MTYAVAHILAAIIFVELFREYFSKKGKKFPRYYILIAAIGGILPDLDFALYYILYFFGFGYEQIHRTFAHTLFIPIILALAGILIYRIGIKNKKIKNMKLSGILIILAAGSLIHIILDATFSGSIMPLYPIIDYSIGLNLIGNLPEHISETILMSLDAALLIFWIFWMEFKLKISKYF